MVRSYCGHGIGQLFHTAPNVPHYKKNKAVRITKKKERKSKKEEEKARKKERKAFMMECREDTTVQIQRKKESRERERKRTGIGMIKRRGRESVLTYEMRGRQRKEREIDR